MHLFPITKGKGEEIMLRKLWPPVVKSVGTLLFFAAGFIGTMFVGEMTYKWMTSNEKILICALVGMIVALAPWMLHSIYTPTAQRKP